MKMKRLTTLLAVVLMAATGLTAQNVAPRGLFKLQRLGYENGRPDHVPEMAQYKLSTDYVPMTLMVRKNTPQDYVYSMRMDEPHPYNCTGDVPVGENGRGTRIYDGYDDRFTLKWYNNLRPNEGAVFPMNEFITEYYDRKNMEPQMVRSIEMLQMKHKKATHRFAGSWRMVGNYGLVDGERILKAPTTHLFKVYGEKDVTFLFCSPQQLTGGTVFYRPLVVKSDNCIKEGDNNECTITWKNDDSFILKFDRGDGTFVEELWKRSGLPKPFQQLFGTDVPVYDVQIPSGF